MAGNSKGQNIKPLVFYPAFGLLIFALILNFANQEAFLKVTTAAKDFMVGQCGWMFSLTGIAAFGIIAAAYFSPLGKIRLGGPDAKPLLKKPTWFAVTLCTTIAAGILFWGTAEPMYHLAYPPESLGIEPFSPQAAKFAMETMYLHWTFVPYAFYAVPTLVFAFAYYNMRKPFSIGSQVSPLLGQRDGKRLDIVIDAICLMAVAAAIAASFGTAVMNMGGGISALTGIVNSPSLWVVITIIGTAAFVISSSTGLMKGIRILSDVNMYVYYAIIAVVLLFGPTAYIFNLGTESFGGFLQGFFSKSLFTGAAAGDPWPSWWTTFYWSNWMAWAPVSAVFLARIAYGYTVRELIEMNFIIPAVFSAIWMTIFSGTAINLQMTGAVNLVDILNTQGAASVGYAVLKQMPLSGLLIALYLFAVLISFVTATDSTTNAMAGISSTGITPDNQEAPIFLKATWGIAVGAIACIFITIMGIDGIKMLSYLGGFPALFLGIASIISIAFLIKNPAKYDVFSGVKASHDINKELHEQNQSVNA